MIITQSFFYYRAVVTYIFFYCMKKQIWFQHETKGILMFSAKPFRALESKKQNVEKV